MLKNCSVLDGERLLILSKDNKGIKERGSLNIQEMGYSYYVKNLKKIPSTRPGEPDMLRPGKQLEINKIDSLKLLGNSPGMDMEVKRVIILPSSSNRIENKSLKELAIQRLQKRKSPNFESLQEYFDICTSCHIIEQVGNEFYCDCYKGIKGKLCNQTVALTYARVPEF